jgi:hypothetical protein
MVQKAGWTLIFVPLLIQKTVIREVLITKTRNDLDKFLEMNEIECEKFTLDKHANEYSICYIRDSHGYSILNFKKDDLFDFTKLCYTVEDFGKDK